MSKDTPIEKTLRIGHDNFVFRYLESTTHDCGCIHPQPETLAITLNGKSIPADKETQRRVVTIYKLLWQAVQITHDTHLEAWMKTNILVEDVLEMLEKYYKVQLGLLLNSKSSAGELEARTFEDLLKDIVLDVVHVKKEIATEVKR